MTPEILTCSLKRMQILVDLSSSSLQPTRPYHPLLASAALCNSSDPLEVNGATVSGHRVGHSISLLPHGVMHGKLEAPLSRMLKPSLWVAQGSKGSSLFGDYIPPGELF